MYIYDAKAASEYQKKWYDRKYAAKIANKSKKELDIELLTKLNTIIRENYPFAKTTKSAYENYQNAKKEANENGIQLPELEINIIKNYRDKSRQFNVPTGAENISVLYPPEADDLTLYRVTSEKGQLTPILYNSMFCDAYIFPLIHIRGQYGWQFDMPRKGALRDDKGQLYIPNKTDDRSSALFIPDAFTIIDDDNVDDDVDGDAWDINKTRQQMNTDADEQNDPDLIVNSDDDEDDDTGALKRKVKSRARVSMLEYYLYHLADRPLWSPIIHCGKLSLQYITEAYYKVERERLYFMQKETVQNAMRVEKKGALNDYIKFLCDKENVLPEKPVLLSSNFYGSSQYMIASYHDAMAIVAQIGFPCYFITVTMNPELIREFIEPYEQPHERVDLIARYFDLMIKELMEDIEKRQIFGKCIGHIRVVEFQQRGIPHVHLVVIIDQDDKPKTPDDIDRVICAQIPDPVKDAKLFDIVTKCMIHGPCGARNPNRDCMVNDDKNNNKKSCNKHYPKEYGERTKVGDDGFVIYKRPFGLSVTRKGKVTSADGSIRYQNHCITNADIVPYCRYLSLKFNCHINVECVSYATVIRYLFDYIHKGPTMARMQLTIKDGVGHYDQIKHYQNCRSLSAHEAIQHLLKLAMVIMSHKVTLMSMHMPNEQTIGFKPSELKDKASRNQLRKRLKNTKLTQLEAFFALNDPNMDKRYDPNAANILYTDIPKHYTWQIINGLHEKIEMLVQEIYLDYPIVLLLNKNSIHYDYYC